MRDKIRKKKKKTQKVIKRRQNGKGRKIDYYKIRQLKIINVYQES